MDMASDPPKTVVNEAAFTADDSEAEVTRIDGKKRADENPRDAPAFPSIFEPTSEFPRYELRRLLGAGGYGRVYAAFDRDLRREVALKLVTPTPGLERELFVREARVTAGLVHPNIPALYDVAERDGTFFLSMEKVSGQSLGSLIRAAADAGAPEVLPPITLMEIVLKVADALEYAHAEGVVHRDVKPDNVMIGSYGEVVLVDWGAAHVARDELSAKGLVIGTPTYMAPEQIQSGTTTPASDIYGLGATLFHALLLRAPIVRSHTERFWQRKARGSIDPPTSAELSRAPRALLGIAMKAMSAQVRDRYPSMKALGEAVRDVLVGRKAWIAPLTEPLEDDSYLERWVSIPEGAFERHGERLVSKGSGGCLLVYKHRLGAGVALEFEGEILPGERPGDLSVVWTDDDVLEPTPHFPTHTISLQIGAFDNLAAGIYRDFWQCLQGRSLSIEVGRVYQIRAEVDEQAFRLFLDGKLIAEYDQLFSTASGHIAIYSYAPGKAFSNLRIFERAVPERVSPTSIGDAFYAQDQFAAAAAQYARVEERLPGTELAEEARFKRGLCWLRDGQRALAQQLWGELGNEAWRARATLHLLDLDFQSRRHERVVDELGALLSHTSSARRLVIDRWVQYVSSLAGSDAAPLAAYAELRRLHFPDDPGSAAAAATLELGRGNYRTVVDDFRDQHPPRFEALCALGEFDRAGEYYRAIPWMYELAQIYLNRFDLVRDKAFVALAHALRDEMDAALALGETCVEACLPARRYDDVLNYRYAKASQRAAALRGMGRIVEAAEQGDARALCQLDAGPDALSSPLVLEERLYLLQYLALRCFERGDWLEYGRHVAAADATPCSAFWSDVWIARYFLFPILERERGDAGACERSARRVIEEFPHYWHGKGEYLARFMLGEIRLDEFEAQPVRMFMRGRSLLARALRAEYVEDAASAAAHYREYLNLPYSHRFSDSPLGDPLVERWAAFRAGARVKRA
jgi:serine/threonine protein kinase/tetratricopeptide (TPR) repeat protein